MAKTAQPPPVGSRFESLPMNTQSAIRSSEILSRAKRIVVKIGSALLVEPKTGRVNAPWLESLAGDLSEMRGQGKEVAIVSSGAIALGRRALELTKGELKLEESQAAAAAGQIHLASAYEDALRPHNITVAQILLTLADSEERRRYLNARSTLNTLLSVGALPIINENDTVATSEIRYGDNDRLAARVAQMISADCLILLSDIDGLYTADPTRNSDAQPVPEVHEITPEIEAMAGTLSPADAMRMGSGGMVTKIMAARICLGAGCQLVISSGREHHPIRNIVGGARCTWFIPKANPLAARKQWIAGSLRPRGTVMIDDGAARALRNGKSLLPAGVTNVEGAFERGDAVAVTDAAGQELARGLTAYSRDDADKIKGHKSSEILALLGYRGRTSMIHADDLVITHRIMANGRETSS